VIDNICQRKDYRIKIIELIPGVKVGRNAPERSSGAHQFGHKRSGAQTSDYLGWNARSTAHNNLG